jgi:hypothetical protein
VKANADRILMVERLMDLEENEVDEIVCSWNVRRLEGGGGSGSMIVCSWNVRGLGEGLKKEK